MDKYKPHITIICSRLDLPGGIERIIANTASLFQTNGHRTTILILDENRNSFYPIHSDVEILQQPLSFGITREGNPISRKIRLLGDVLKLRRVLKSIKADIIISTEYPFTVACMLAGAKKYSKVLSWEHHHHDWLKKNKFWSMLSEMAYPKLDSIITLNKREADHFKKYTGVTVIPNFIENRSGKYSTAENKTILSIGWLIPRKGIDMMLETAKTILTDHPDWKWKLIGDGEMKEDVSKFIHNNNWEDKFILQSPSHADLSSEYANASIFVLTSRYEAFPMVLLEALSFGLPCISFDSPSGPADIITHEKDGLIVEKENTAKMTEAISQLIKDDSLRKKMGRQAIESMKRFSPDMIYEEWRKLFEMLLHSAKENKSMS